MTIYDDYVEYTKQYKLEYGEQTLVLIEVGSFWEIYNCDKNLGADMKCVGDLLNIQVSKKNKSISEVSARNPYMAGFPSHSLQRFLPILIESDFTVVLVSQVTLPPNPLRKVTSILSKGTYVTDTAHTSNYIMCAYSCNGVSVIDLSNGASYVHEGNNESMHKLIAMYRPCEFIATNVNIIPHFVKTKVYTSIKPIEKLHLQTEVLDNAFDNPSMLSIIEYLDLEFLPNALTAFATLVDFCSKHNPSVVLKLKKPEIIGTSDYLDMYYNTIEQLDVEGLNKVLNRCMTAMGKRYFRKRLMNPFKNSNMIQSSYDKLMSMDLSKATFTRKQLSNVYDLERLFRKIELGLIQINDFQNVATSCQFLDIGKDVSHHIEDHIDFERGMLKGDDEITSVQQSLDDLSKSIQDVVENLNKVYNVDYFKTEKTDRDGYCIVLTSKRYKEVLGCKKGNATIDLSLGKPVTTTNSVKIYHPFLDTIWKEEETLKTRLNTLHAEKYKVFLVDFNRLFQSKYKQIVDIICDLDFVSNCVKNNHEFRYVCPRINATTSSSAKFIQVRHPIIERVSDSISYVGNDVTMDQKGMLLYGLNASGKSSLIKAVGLNIIMAQAGMFVAATQLDLVPYSSIFCRISKADNMYAGQSTFMVEMSELRKILNNATSESIVLADELCAGTESISAISIVSSAICTLTNRKTAFIFATHLHELTRIKQVIPLVSVYHLDVYFDKVTDVLIYNRTLRQGQGSELYGLEVCKALDMDTDFLNTANEIRADLMKVPRKTKYNSKVIVDKCKICKGVAQEVHHIVEQHTADDSGYIGTIHKNHKSNLVPLCSDCHDKIHKKEIIIQGFKSTSRGFQLVFNCI